MLKWFQRSTGHRGYIVSRVKGYAEVVSAKYGTSLIHCIQVKDCMTVSKIWWHQLSACTTCHWLYRINQAKKYMRIYFKLKAKPTVSKKFLVNIVQDYAEYLREIQKNMQFFKDDIIRYHERVYQEKSKNLLTLSL